MVGGAEVREVWLAVTLDGKADRQADHQRLVPGEPSSLPECRGCGGSGGLQDVQGWVACVQALCEHVLHSTVSVRGEG